MKKLFPILFLAFYSVLFSAPRALVFAAQLEESRVFDVESIYDSEKREQVSAILKKISPQLYWYLDEKWWQGLSSQEQAEVKETLNVLTEEFEYKIYPTLTQTFGSEWSPGIDKDTRVAILIHPMIKEAGGYFDSADEYPKVQVPESNEREMIYLNSSQINSLSVKAFLSHEFMHLITFNQKEKTQKISEEVRLNEARSEYAPTLLGYDANYSESNLERRVKSFLDKPYDSLTEWKNQPSDYGVVNLFIQYLVDYYGVQILADSLKSSTAGITSLNSALKKNGFKEDFSQIFTDWTIAVLVNNCDLGPRYCYLNKNLEQFKVAPLTNFLPRIGKSTLSATNTTTNWAGNWHKFIGGQEALKLEFSGNEGVKFRVPYVTSDVLGNPKIDFLTLDGKQKGEKFFSDFGKEITSLTIIPSIQSKTSNFSDKEPLYSFFWQVSTGEKIPNPQEEEKLIQELLAQIENLKKEIAKVQAQIQAILAQKEGGVSCLKIENNLYLGLSNNQEVKCLQEFLKSQGPEIYPEGLITGNFFALTKTAVIRFQEKYASDILVPSRLEKGNGFVGYLTRQKINEILNPKS